MLKGMKQNLGGVVLGNMTNDNMKPTQIRLKNSPKSIGNTMPKLF